MNERTWGRRKKKKGMGERGEEEGEEEGREKMRYRREGRKGGKEEGEERMKGIRRVKKKG